MRATRFMVKAHTYVTCPRRQKKTTQFYKNFWDLKDLLFCGIAFITALSATFKRNSLFGGEFKLLQFGIGLHSMFLVISRQIEHTEAVRMETGQGDELILESHRSEFLNQYFWSRFLLLEACYSVPSGTSPSGLDSDASSSWTTASSCTRTSCLGRPEQWAFPFQSCSSSAITNLSHAFSEFFGISNRGMAGLHPDQIAVRSVVDCAVNAVL